jgi:Tol biopolymer transport system component
MLKSMLNRSALFLGVMIGLTTVTLSAQTPNYGVFESAADIGKTMKGATQFDNRQYRITSGGANMWAKTDAFHFVWKRVSGDFTLTADVQFIGEGKNPHRKVVLIARGSLESGAAYADAAVHGDGLTALQYRPVADEVTSEVKLTNWFGSMELIPANTGPRTIRLERRGNQFIMYGGKPGEAMKASPAVTVDLKDPVYVGLGVCSHEADVQETAVFSNVKLEERWPIDRELAMSKICVFDLETKTTEVIYTANTVFEAPNWSPDGKYLLVNSAGKLYRLPLATRELQEVDLGEATHINNDHGISSDGKWYVVSSQAPPDRSSKMFVLPSTGGAARRITKNTPSYYHGWSPDDKWLAYAAFRGTPKNLDIYRVSFAGGEEERLTSFAGADDGPDYTADGNWIYWNSNESGNYDIWRMPATGAGTDNEKAEQVTKDGMEDWFPHPSPDGKWLVFLSFKEGIKNHPANKDVVLRLMPLPGQKLGPATPRVIVKLFGGQGTINVNSWSPDSKKFAFVSYELLK